MTDEEIIAAVRSGTHTLVPMPGDGRKFFIGSFGDAEIEADNFVLILDLDADKFEGEEVAGAMIGELTASAMDGRGSGPCDDKDIPF